MILEKLRILLVVLSKVANPLSVLSLWFGYGNSQIIRSGKVKTFLRNNKIDYWIFIENIIEDTYGLRNLKFLKFDNIIDIGGNIGLFTVATKKYWPKARRTIVEPNKNSLLVLKKNLKLNKIRAKVLNRAVIGDKTAKKIKFFFNENPAMSSVISSLGKSVKVKTANFSEIIPENGLSLVKIDIEGGEYLLFKSKLEDVFGRISVLLMETHDIDKKRNYHAIVSFLKNAGFKVYYKNRQITAFNLKRISI